MFKKPMHFCMEENTDGKPAGGDAPPVDEPQGDAYKKALREKDNWREKAKTTEARAIELEAQLKAIENKKLEENNEWKKIAENERSAREQFELKLQERDKADERRLKESVVKKEFRKHGIEEDSIDVLMPLVKLDELKYDPDTKAIWGYEEQVKMVKDKLPRLFGSNEKRPLQTPPSVNPSMPRIDPADWRSNVGTSLEDHYKKLGVDLK